MTVVESIQMTDETPKLSKTPRAVIAHTSAGHFALLFLAASDFRLLLRFSHARGHPLKTIGGCFSHDQRKKKCTHKHLTTMLL